MAAQKDWDAERDWVREALERIQESVDNLGVRIDEMRGAREAFGLITENRLSTMEERAKWVAFGVSSVVSSVVAVIATICYSVVKVLLIGLVNK